MHLSDQLAANLRAEMGRRRLTQRGLAETLGVSVSKVRALTLGRGWMADDLEAIAHHLGLRPEALLATVEREVG